MSAPIAELFRRVADNMTRVADSDYASSIERAIEAIDQAFVAGHKLLVFGNGGSSTDAQHIACELVGRFLTDRSGLPAIALTTNQAVLTAWSNDHSFTDVFARQVQALGNTGDVAWGISTSGKSPNVLDGLKAARARGLTTIGMTGPHPGPIDALCDVLLAAPVEGTPRIQEVHLVTYHAICSVLEQRQVSRQRA